MADVSVNGVPHEPVLNSQSDGISPDRLRTIVQDSHLNFLIGAGAPEDVKQSETRLVTRSV